MEVGKNVINWKVGDRVVAEPQSKACGICAYCRTGRISMCPEKRSPGWGSNGGMAEYVAMSANLLHGIPDTVSFDLASIVEPLSIAVHAMTENTCIEPEDIVLVFGPGPIGILSALVAKRAGAYKVIIVGTLEDELIRLKVARDAGVEYVMNVEKDDICQKILDLTNNFGVDMVVDTSGSESAIDLGITVLKKQGRFCGIGFSSEDNISINWNKCVVNNLNLFFEYSSTYTSWERSLKMLSGGNIDFGKIITRKTGLADWKESFDSMEKKNAIKILLEP